MCAVIDIRNAPHICKRIFKFGFNYVFVDKNLFFHEIVPNLTLTERLLFLQYLERDRTNPFCTIISGKDLIFN